MASLESIRIWVNAFVPGNVPGATQPWPGQPGLSLIDSPVGYFATDHRGFSSDPNASAREHVEIVVHEPDSAQPRIEILPARYGTTVNVEATTGAVLGQATATALPSSLSHTSDTGFMPPRAGAVLADPVAGVRDLDAAVAEHDRILVADVNLAAGNPLVPGVPKMDVHGTILVNLTQRTVSFQGVVDDFPAYEAYVQVNGGPPKTLFQVAPTGGPGSVADVLGNAGLFGPARMPLSVTTALDADDTSDEPSMDPNSTAAAGTPSFTPAVSLRPGELTCRADTPDDHSAPEPGSTSGTAADPATPAVSFSPPVSLRPGELTCRADTPDDHSAPEPGTPTDTAAPPAALYTPASPTSSDATDTAAACTDAGI
jgi:hypothetical protein